mmetsp:Transcript_19467/g.23304  ORF Transcript_19467/g.23304 Transcript_19467/m.23304 type:complete len:263 (-) Transcript_19467:227-1015(-)|eukprot:CAMPEP_0197851832 /NCGR_PEP_ID=MMETSP1438-20131217/18988_1 /TAXON_ID=1461541 /ORGANISM="Pterosperma sp., Strain CCMP1384" /LENGTH=262 /DNA_ID=CAMNT_0043465585 /DNA_START=104 /DNA_END=892 /DNA_ORIENTATION=+
MYGKIAIAALLGLGVAHADNGVSGDYDFYVLEQSWQPEFCHGQYDTWPGCSKPAVFGQTHMTLHGLWPQYKVDRQGKSYPDTCLSTCKYPADLSQDVVKSLVDDLDKYWPDCKVQPGPDGIDFWGHEWNKHGTCSGLSQQVYLQSAMDTLQKVGTPDAIVNNVGKEAKVSDIQAGYGGADMVVLNCEGGKYLFGTSTCWAKNSDFTVGEQIKCENVQADDACTGETVIIQGFPSEGESYPILRATGSNEPSNRQTSRKLMFV